jgi:UDP-N-acetylmuramate dehydrogenase
MKFLRAISRVFAGLVFLLAGFLKLSDPVGNGLVVSEYFKLAGLADMPSLALWTGLILSVTETIIGISILLGLRMKVASKALLIFVSFFTLLTLYLALYNPISDCGCFGEVIKLTNWETFYKNTALLVASLLIYFQRDKFIPLAPAAWEWGTMALYAVLLSGIGIYALRNLPIVDFTPFHTGTDINEELAMVRNPQQPSYLTELIYEKDGKQETFSLEELPDSTWTFIDSRTTPASVERFSTFTDFAVSDSSGSYVTDSLLSLDKLFITIVPKLERMSKKEFLSVKTIHEKIEGFNIPHIVLCGASFDDADSTKKAMGFECDIYFTDFKTLIAMNRSNGGLIYLSRGVVGAKWSLSNFKELSENPENIQGVLDSDPELLSAQRRIKETLAAEISLLSLLLLIVLMRYIFRFAYSHNIMQEKTPEVENTLIGKELILKKMKDQNLKCKVEWRRNLKNDNTLHLNSTADWYAAPSDEEELAELFSVEEFRNMERLITGSGSNILYKGDFNGLVIHPAMNEIVIDNEDDQFVYLRVGAGVDWDYLVSHAVDRGWGGLENLSLIPGCVGASPVQNIGAYGAEAADCIVSVSYFDTELLEMREIKAVECKFGYRDSIFKSELKGRAIITRVIFRLTKHPVINANYADLAQELSVIEKPAIGDIREIVCKIRESKLPDPNVTGNAGSFFKNPVIPAEQASALQEEYPSLKIFQAEEGFSKVPAAWLIDQCGFKGIRKGNVGVHEKQALVLLAFEGAKGKELLDLADEIRTAVKERFNIDIEPEVNIV